MALRDILEEELANSLRMEASYVRALAGLPVGSLVKRRIKGHEYYYLVFRAQGKVRSEYRGRPVRAEIRRYREARTLRAKYRQLLAQCRRQIAFLRRTLRGQAAV